MYLKSTNGGGLELAHPDAHEIIVRIFSHFSSHCQLKMGHHGSICTSKIGKHNKKQVSQHTTDWI